MRNQLQKSTNNRHVEAGDKGDRASTAELVVRPNLDYRLSTPTLFGRLVSGPLWRLRVSHVELRRFWSCLWAHGSVCLLLICWKCEPWILVVFSCI
jgi:hypothetical protein